MNPWLIDFSRKTIYIQIMRNLVHKDFLTFFKHWCEEFREKMNTANNLLVVISNEFKIIYGMVSVPHRD